MNQLFQPTFCVPDHAFSCVIVSFSLNCSAPQTSEHSGNAKHRQHCWLPARFPGFLAEIGGPKLQHDPIQGLPQMWGQAFWYSMVCHDTGSRMEEETLFKEKGLRW